MLDTNTLLHGLTALFITVIGWYINRAVREKDRFEASTNASFKDVDIRVQLLEQRIAVTGEKSESQDRSIERLHEDLADIRDNMVRKEDLYALTRRIDDAMRDK